MGDQIRAAALRWALLKRVAEHIRDRRESFDSCPRETWDESKGENWVAQSPCWKQRVYSLAHDDEVPLPRSEWCHDCLDRQTYHDALVLVVPMRAGAQRGLFKRCQTALAEAAHQRLRQEGE